MTLDALGPRICVLGPSNSGKSTLAAAIGAARGLVPVHLDQLRHLPHTDWRMRPWDDFVALHDAAIAGERWVMDGNYTKCLPRRLARATGMILLDVSATLSLSRYLRRSWFERDRRGALEGASDAVRWEMVRHILTVARGNRGRHRRLFEAAEVPKLSLPTARDIDLFYRAERLVR